MPSCTLALIQHKGGAQASVVDRGGLSALDHAVDCGDPAVVAALLEAGLDVNGSNTAQWSPLMRCGRVIFS